MIYRCPSKAPKKTLYREKTYEDIWSQDYTRESHVCKKHKFLLGTRAKLLSYHHLSRTALDFSQGNMKINIF